MGIRDGRLKILTFTVSSDTKELDDDEGDEENSNPHGLSIRLDLGFKDGLDGADAK